MYNPTSPRFQSPSALVAMCDPAGNHDFTTYEAMVEIRDKIHRMAWGVETALDEIPDRP